MSVQAAERSHSALGFSAMHRWGECPGSVALIETLGRRGLLEDDGPKDAADEGTAAHEVLAACAPKGHDAWTWIGEKIEVAGREWEVTGEMADAVQAALDYIAPMYARGKHYVEHPVAADHISPRLFGTADFLHWANDTKTLTVVDYKHGAGVHVEAEGNVQALGYASAARETLNVDPKTIRCVIVQPRDRHDENAIREWEIEAAFLDDWETETLAPAVAAVEAGMSAELNPGEAQCRFCPAALHCPATRAVVDEAAGVESVADVTLDDLGALIDKAEIAAKVLREAKARAMKAIEQGGEVTGWKAVVGRGNRTWKEGAGDTLRETIGDDAFTSPALKSPAQVERLSADMKKTVANLAYHPTGTPKLVRAHEKGDQWQPKTAKDTFANVRKEE